MPDSFERYLLGLALLTLVVVPIALGAVTVRRRFVPALDGAAAPMAATVLALATVLAIAHLLGAVGLLYAVPLAVVCAAVGGSAWWWTRGAAPPVVHAQAPEKDRELIAAWVICGAVSATWVARTADTFVLGLPRTFDTWWNHLPLGAYFAQQHSFDGLLRTLDEPVVSFYPADSSLLHGIGMLLFDSDVLSPLLNLGALGLVLMSASALGDAARARPLVLMTAALLLALPVLRGTQPGEATNDALVLGLVVASAAALWRGGTDRGALVVSGLALGVAIGVKLTMLAAAGVWGLAVLALAGRGHRVAAGLSFGLPATAAAATWYLRNWIETGSPVPMVALPGWDPPASYFLDGPVAANILQTVSSTDSWDTVFLPALERQFGVAWPLLLLAGAAGIVAGLLRGGVPRLLGAVALAGAASFVVTPTGGALFEGQLRHPIPSLGIGLALLMAEATRRTATRRAMLVATGGLTLLTLTADALGPAAGPRDSAAALAVVLAVAGLGLLPRDARPLAACGAVTIALLAAGWHHHGRGRLDFSAAPVLHHGDATGLSPAFRWAEELTGQRIGVVGTFLNYPLYGRDLSNVVRYVGRDRPNGGFVEIASCREFLRTVTRMRLRFVVTAAEGDEGPRLVSHVAHQATWLDSVPGARRVLGAGGPVTVHALPPGRLPESGCAN